MNLLELRADALAVRSRRALPAAAMTLSRSVTATLVPVDLLSVSHSCAANSSTPPMSEYFLKMTSPSLLV